MLGVVVQVYCIIIDNRFKLNGSILYIFIFDVLMILSRSVQMCSLNESYGAKRVRLTFLGCIGICCEQMTNY